jgi:hypothetical protein
MRASSLTENGPVDHPRTPSFETALRAAHPGRSLNLSGPRAGGPVTTVRLGRPLNPTRQPTTRDLVIFIAALVGVPLYALIALAYLLDERQGQRLVGRAASCHRRCGGGSIGGLRSPDSVDPTHAQRTRGTDRIHADCCRSAAWYLQSPSAPLGRCVVDGWAAGFFIAFVFLLVNLWRNNQDFRERIRTIRT